MEQELTTKKYNIIIGLVLLWGVSVNAVVCAVFPDVFMEWDARTVFGVYSVLATVAVLKPEIFESSETMIIVCIVAILIFETVINLSGGVPGHWWDGLVAFLFSTYIGVSWTRAQKREKTVDNAVDSPVRMYLDFINLFVRVIGSKIRR